MKILELLEGKSEDLIGGGLPQWREKFGASKEDIKEAMRQARELPIYKELVQIAPDITTKIQEQNGTICFKHPGTHSFERIYVHMYGQVRSGYADLSRNSPVKSPTPTIYPGDPVKSILKAYETGFEIIKKTVIRAKKVYRHIHVKQEIQDLLDSKFGQHSVIIYYDRYHKGNAPIVIGVYPRDFWSLHMQLYGGRRSPEAFLGDMLDDETDSDLIDNLKKQDAEKHKNKLSYINKQSSQMHEVTEFLKSQGFNATLKKSNEIHVTPSNMDTQYTERTDAVEVIVLPD